MDVSIKFKVGSFSITPPHSVSLFPQTLKFLSKFFGCLLLAVAQPKESILLLAPSYVVCPGVTPSAYESIPLAIVKCLALTSLLRINIVKYLPSIYLALLSIYLIFALHLLAFL